MLTNNVLALFTELDAGSGQYNCRSGRLYTHSLTVPPQSFFEKCHLGQLLTGVT